MPGLYAAGETACVSVHGGNRLGANSLLDTLVFGRRSGEHASEWVKTQASASIDDTHADRCLDGIKNLLDRKTGEMFGQIRLDLGQSMNKHLAVYRDQKGMEQAKSDLAELKRRYSSVMVQDKNKIFNTNLIFTLELGFMLDCAETTIIGALERKESRGAHTRTDMPDRDDENWLKHIVVSQIEGKPKVDYDPVNITKWQPQERKY